MTKATRTLAFVTIFAATPVLAMDAEIDADADGMYSYPELQTAMPEMTEDQFIVMDVNGDGLLDETEVAAATEAGLLPATEG
ncbi:hypothetical protein SAMN05444003_0881 [Cognatiyoonia sediminum]|uniref:EF-hand domain-containing protein n=1 Tax=Cognatiyoonia sediminum TaxID=1508389 RepID=A0A1M5MLC7_9RHOB|nr:hypothetical protein [Cognatiyoonia sediminum]SHG77852.1 hypothetical protein SAMN05444003_0881 [Cognatiyoonia sediminum]